MDTDEEVSNGRVNLLNGTGPPYFHGYLYMKSEYLYQITTQQAHIILAQLNAAFLVVLSITKTVFFCLLLNFVFMFQYLYSLL